MLDTTVYSANLPKSPRSKSEKNASPLSTVKSTYVIYILSSIGIASLNKRLPPATNKSLPPAAAIAHTQDPQ